MKQNPFYDASIIEIEITYHEEEEDNFFDKKYQRRQPTHFDSRTRRIVWFVR